MNNLSDERFGADRAEITAALEALANSTGIAGVVSHKDATTLSVRLKVGATSLDYHCHVSRKIDRFATLDELRARLAKDKHALLVCPSLSTALAEHCRVLDLQFIDTAGNVYLHDDNGILINVLGRKLAKLGSSTSRNSTVSPSVLRLMFGILAEPKLLNAPYREIAGALNVATGAIGQGFETLEEAGLIGSTASNQRLIRLPEQLLGEWATGYLHRLRPRLEKYRFSATASLDLASAWSPEYRVSAWSGEQAAATVTGHLKAATWTIYMDMQDRAALTELVRSLRLRADPQGAIEVVRIFWNSDRFADFFPTVPYHLIYADLLETNDSRNLDVAKLLVPKVIAHVHNAQGQTPQ